MLNITDYESAGEVFRFFEEISGIPRGSGNTAKIAEYLVNFAKERGLEHYRDEYDNVIIKKPATKGYENRPAVILQGHTDIVAVKTTDCPLNLERDGIILYRDGDFIRAKETSLGADDGIAVAYALAILDSDEIEHPHFEAVFTTDEEVGLTGAAGLDCSKLDGNIMINIDSDDEGVFTVGCAGGLRIDLTCNMTQTSASGIVCSFNLSSLRGGHSGIEINCGRTNAIKALCAALEKLGEIRLISLDCGTADNAIPTDASVTFIIEKDKAALVKENADATRSELITLGENDADICVAMIEENDRKALTREDSMRILSLINELPSGVLEMSSDIEGLVETSQNLGIAKLFSGEMALTISVRSSKGKKKREAADAIHGIAKAHGVLSSERSEYPAWEYKKDSHLRDVMCETYEKMYGRKPKVLTIHAGLECGIFSGKMPMLDCVSMGPDNYDIHTTGEHLSIPSVARVYEYLKEVLKNI